MIAKIINQVKNNINICKKVVGELKLYVQEPDPNFVSKSIKALCSIAIKYKLSVESYFRF